MLDQSTSLLLFGLYALFIILLVWGTKKKHETSEDFLVMERSLGTFRGAMSMAVSWIWAPAVFICSMQAYNQGLPGIFWFTAPNIITFFVFVPFALKMRRNFPQGYTISQAFRLRFQTKFPHYAALIVAFGYQLGAVIINCVAGATLIHLLSGLSYASGVLMMGGLALSYSLISGLRASVISDVAQMLMILVVACLIVPWSIIEIGGLPVMATGLGGVSGEFGNIFDPSVAYAFGIATTISLIAGPVADQMFSQRAFAAKEGALVKIFVYAGLIFGVVPIILSLLGFIGAAGVQNGLLEVSDPQMVGPEVVGQLLPTWALGLFAVMAFAGLTSTLDSAFTAIGSLTAIDLGSPDANMRRLNIARLGMVIVAVLGIAVALLKPQLLWVFLIYGALAASLFLPTLLMLFWDRLTATGAGWGIVSGIIVGTPLAGVANVIGDIDLIVLSAVLSLLVGGVIAVLVSLVSKSSD